MMPDRVSNPGPLTLESGALPIALRGPAWFLGHLVIWFAWKIPSSYVHYLRNKEIKIKSKIKQT